MLNANNFGSSRIERGQEMIARLLVGSLVGAVVLMVWGALFWTVMPFTRDAMRAVEAEDAILDILDQHITETGVYFMPLVDMYDKSKQDAFFEKHERGPLARISFRKEGVDARSPMVFIKGFLHFFVSVLFLAGLMISAFPRLATYRSRVVFIFFVGLFAAFFTHLSDVVWMHAPLRYAIYYMDFHILGWLLVGLVISPIVKPALTRR
jgi:hypothetical protein